MDKQQIVFLETQGQALHRSKASLTGVHADWQILFLADAPAALDLISQREVGVVIANFGADSNECEGFFSSLREREPQIIRIGLLPDQGKQNIVKSIEYAHTCIAADCDASKMGVLIERALHVWGKARSNERLAQLMSNLHTIPTPPALYFDIRDEMESPNGTARSVAAMIAKDPAITAKLFKVANSGFYGGASSNADLDEVITLLGMDLVLALVLSAHLYDQLPVPGIKLDELWKHSIAVATLAKEIALHARASHTVITSCVISGLLHDLGQLVFLSNMPESYHTLIRNAGGNEIKLLEMELDKFGVGHPELGALILSLWGLPGDVVKAIANHHATNLHALPDLSLTTRAVCMAESILQSHQLQDSMEWLDNAGASSTVDGPVKWAPLMEKLAEQGLIPPRKQRENPMH